MSKTQNNKVMLYQEIKLDCQGMCLESLLLDRGNKKKLMIQLKRTRSKVKHYHSSKKLPSSMKKKGKDWKELAKKNR